VLAHRTSNTTHQRLYWISSAVMAGASYWVRYAGLLWALPLFIFFLVRIVWAKRNPSRSSAISGAALLALFVIPVMLRNSILVGTWRGGNNTAVAVSKSHLLFVDTPKLIFHLLLGDATLAQLKFAALLVSLGIVGLGCLYFTVKIPMNAPSSGAWIVLTACSIYSSGIVYIASSSVISYIPRMYVPVLPHWIALAVYGVGNVLRRLPAGIHRSIATALIACLLLGYGIGNSISRFSLEPDQYRKTATAMNSLRQLLDNELKPGEVIASTNGQAAGYALNHPTLSLVGRPYSLLNWDAPELANQFARFSITHLLVFRDAALDPVIEQSPFLGELAHGKHPAWLQPVGFNRDLYVYKFEKSGTN